MNMAVLISSSILFLAVWLGFKILNGEFSIKPSKVIGENYLSRWHIIPRNKFFNIYLHKFTGSDDDRAMHDHPFASVSILLKGKLMELRRGKNPRHPRRFVPVFRWPSDAHRLVLNKHGVAWTLFITGPRIREWGFWCGKEWKHWTTMTTADGKQIGGCDD